MDSRWSLADKLASRFLLFREARQTRPKFYHSIPFDIEAPAARCNLPEPPALPVRPLIRIGVAELADLLTTAHGLVVMDLRAGAQWRPFPISNVFVLPIAPYELADVLDRLPSDRSLVLFGAAAHLDALGAASAGMQGSAPLYLVNDSFDHQEQS